MKIIEKYIIIIAFLSITYGCIEDKGNYDYLSSSEIMPLEIKNLQEEITIEVGNTLTIEPDIINMKDPDKYIYEWYVMENKATNNYSTRKDIGNSKNLSYKVELDPGSWRLCYKITDIQRNVYIRDEIKLTIIATAVDNKGWYILKDNNDETDFDYINLEGKIYNNVLSEKGLQLPGKAVYMEYQNGLYYQNITDENNNIITLSNQTVFHITSTKEIYTINSKTIELFKNFKDQFYNVPETCQPQYYMYVFSGFSFLQNAGRLYTIQGNMANIGKLFPITGSYQLYEQGVPIGLKNCIVFDEKEHSLLYADGNNDYLTYMPDLKQDNIIYSFKNMPYSVVCIGHNIRSGSWSGQGYIIMQHNNMQEGALVRIMNSMSFVPSVTSFSTIPQESKLLQTNLVEPAFNGDFLYFKYENNIYSYENTKELPLIDKEKKIISYPENEQITSIKQIFVAESSDNPQINQLAVLTTQNNKWKLYIYNLLGESNPEINPEPINIYEGEGNGQFLLYRAN